jgi:hypothetical protein
MEIYHIISIIKITHFFRKAKKIGVLPVFFVAPSDIISNLFLDDVKLVQADICLDFGY